MKRNAIKYLYQWKASNDRKPLIMLGARQVGKTWLMQEFAKEAYTRSAYVNFEDNEMLREVFAHDFDIPRIINSIQWSTGVSIDENTLIIFDEIQEAPRGITALKYFAEKAPQYHVVAAGSLLGIAMHQNDSFPVGKVDFMHLYPLTFFEFLDAIGESRMVELLMSKDWNMITMFRNKFEECLRQYYLVGGMPAVVQSFASEGNLSKVRSIQKGILEAYERDFSKHAPAIEVPRIRMVWKSIPSQLAKENKKFIYGAVKEGARAKDFEIAIQWLTDAGLVHKVERTRDAKSPLKFYADMDAFKLYVLDVGLLGALTMAQPDQILIGNNVFSEYKGAFTENFVLQQLKSLPYLPIYYYSKPSSTQEIDFIVQAGSEILPIEVKAEENVKAKSLAAFITHDFASYHLKGIRFSMRGFQDQKWMENVPLFAAREFVKHKVEKSFIIK